MIGLPGLRNRKVVAQRSPGELDAMAAGFRRSRSTRSRNP
jgi:hypothetical protein